jgi:hypothetical protein
MPAMILNCLRFNGPQRTADLVGTQQIDRCWNHLKKNCPSQMKNRTGPTINARFWHRFYQWIYRHNMSKWDMTTKCEMKKRLLKLFVDWCRNWSLKKWHNVRRFGTWMSKTHGCVNPCYHVDRDLQGHRTMRPFICYAEWVIHVVFRTGHSCQSILV